MNYRIFKPLLVIILFASLQSCLHKPQASVVPFNLKNRDFSQDEIVDLGLLVNEAYKQYRGNRATPNPEAPTEFVDGFKPVANILSIGQENGMPEEFFGFVVRSQSNPQVLVLALRGTVDANDWVAEIDVRKVNFNDEPELGKVEKGFHSIYSSLRVSVPDLEGSLATTKLVTVTDYITGLDDVTQVVVAGHSLGSSLATLIAMDVVVQQNLESVYLLAFAPPKTGDESFVSSFESAVTRSIAVVNERDIVPRVPFGFLGFEQLSNVMKLDSSTNFGLKKSVICSHSLLSYLHIIDDSIEPESKCKLHSI